MPEAMATFYNDGNETSRQREGHDAPEAVNGLSPVASRSSIGGELRRQYSRRSAQLSRSAADLDTDKEVVPCFEMDSGAATPYQGNPQAPGQAGSPPQSMPVSRPRATLLLPEMEDHSTTSFPNAGGASFANTGTASVENAGQGDLDRNTDRRESAKAVGEERGERKIMGLRHNVFWVVMMVLVVLVVAAAVGGGVGAVVASRSKKSPKPARKPAEVKPAEVKFLNNQTWDKDNLLAFQGFARPDFNGMASPIFTGDGTKDFAVDLQFDVHSFAWIPGVQGCCINLCANVTNSGRMGFVCGRRKERVTPRAVMRVFVWCADGENGIASQKKGCGELTR